MYTDVVARPRELRPRHSVENQWDLLEALGVEPPRLDGWGFGEATGAVVQAPA